MGRLIGVRYRTKQTTKGEARPTMVAVKTNGNIVKYKLSTEDDEVDFAKGQFPVSWRTVGDTEDISVFKPHHCQWRKVKDDEDVSKLNPAHLRKVETTYGEETEICAEVPETFDGLCEGDNVAMALGAGNKLAALLYIKGKRVGAKVHRTPPMYLDKHRANPDKEQDHFNLLDLLEQQPSLFYEVRPPDAALIKVALLLDQRQLAQHARIAYGNRLLQSAIGETYLEEEEELEGLIADRCKAMLLSDVGYQALVSAEKRCDDELKKAMHATNVWQIAASIPGLGHRIFAGIVGPIGDVRRFIVPPNFEGADSQDERQKRKNKALEKGAAKLMKFCGVHTCPSPTATFPDFYRGFARHQKGVVGNWSPAARQASYLFGDQLNRKPNSHWGKKLLDYKLGFRQKHPEVIKVDKKLVSLYRALEVFFRIKAGVQIQPEGFKISSVEELLVWFKDSCQEMTAEKVNILGEEILQWRERIQKAQVEGEVIQLFTPGHILRMAKWRTLTRFVRWLFKQWVRIENQTQSEDAIREAS